MLHLERPDDEFIANITKDSAVAETTELFQSTWATTVIVVKEGCVVVFIPLALARSFDERAATDVTAILLFFKLLISFFEGRLVNLSQPFVLRSLFRCHDFVMPS